MLNVIKLGCHSFYRSLKQQGCRRQKFFSNFIKSDKNLCITERHFGECLCFIARNQCYLKYDFEGFM